ncbi:hypothetical protein [Bartonella harrusi]|uniref:Uncharacterized protein n=1 Tax=Bartonella harrusi TaxID=2961895 RepID=A0ABY5EU69_9HYPH|nr:hypothetical protein [Bartonella harrusi]UTO28033.1 hypothetical protein NMK50_07435 [Bartonella harrusi]
MGEAELFGGLPEGNLPKRGSVFLSTTVLKVSNGTAVHSRKSGGFVTVYNNSRMS